MKDKTVVTASGHKVDESVSMKAGSSSRRAATNSAFVDKYRGS